jgi:hypothetical protein
MHSVVISENDFNFVYLNEVFNDSKVINNK